MLFIVLSMFLLLLQACSFLNATNKTQHAKEEEFKKTDYEKENYVRVQDYTGEGFKLRDSKEKNGEIARNQQEVVEKGVKDFFLKNYRTEVKINNIVSAVDGAVVYVESVKEPKFHTFAIVPVNSKNKTVSINRIWSLEGEVESSLATGLYVLAFQDEFQKLDNYLQDVVDNHPVVGMSEEMITNIGGEGYLSPYYFMSPFGDAYDQLVAEYLENPEMSSEEVRDFLNNHSNELYKINITIELFMEDEYTSPDQQILDEVAANIEEMDGIPAGEYSIFIHDNYIDKKRGVGFKENTLERTNPNKIRKE